MLKDTAPFWKWFQANQEKYRNIHRHDMDTINMLLDELVAELKLYSEGLYVEIGGREEPFELIITPQGIKDYFSDAEYLVQHALPVDGWKYFALKPVHGMNFDFKMGDMELKPESIFFRPLTDEEDPEKIGVCILHKDYQTMDTARQNALINGLYYCLDSVLGERAVTLDINFLEFDTLPEDTSGTDILTVAELVNYISWRKKERKSYEVRLPEGETALLKGQLDGKPIMLLVNKGYKYYNYTTDFPYLLDIRLHYNQPLDDGLPSENMEGIYEIEDFITGTIGSNGHHIVSESHDGIRAISCYVDTAEHATLFTAAIKSRVTTHIIDIETVFDMYWVRMKDYL